VLKHVLDDIFQLVQRHQPDHPKLPILKRTYDLVLSGKDIKTNETDRAPSSEDRPNKKTSQSEDASTDSSHSQAQDKATTSEARDAIADSSAHEAPNVPISSGAKHAEDDCSANQAQNPATEDMADMTNSKEQAEEDDCSANQAQNPGAEEEEQATKEGCSSPHVEEALEHNIDPTEVEAALTVAEGAITQILASEQSAQILEERGKLMVNQEGNKEVHPYEAPLSGLSIPPTFEEQIF